LWSQEDGMAFQANLNKWLVHWLVVTLAILMSPYVISGIHLAGPGAALAAAAVLGVLNVLVRPIIILFTLPLTILSLGFFLVIINSFMLYMTAWIVGGFSFDTFWSAFWLGLLISLATTVLARPVRRDGRFAFSFRNDGHARFRERYPRQDGVVDLNEKDGKWQ
jgi:putative membrane protein